MNIQDLLTLKAQQELEQQISAEEAALIGAGVLGTGGLALGHGAHTVGRNINKTKVHNKHGSLQTQGNSSCTALFLTGLPLQSSSPNSLVFVKLL